MTFKVTLDKIGSATKNAVVERDVYLTDEIIAKEGYVVAVRVLYDKAVYNLLENIHGRMMRVKPGDVVAGVLGQRRALRGYSGDVPAELHVGDRLNILNMGGVIGRCTSFAPDVGEPFETELVGAVLHFPNLGERTSEPAHIGLNAIPDLGFTEVPAPVIAVVGTCMNAGKTAAACEIIHGLVRNGFRVAAAKVTGVALERDMLNMRDHGAYEALSFNDAGLASTGPGTSLAAAKRIVSRLGRSQPQVIVLEFGDGLLGEYGIHSILADQDFRSWIRAVVLCANDPVGASGAVSLLKERYELSTSVVTGPVTDNEVGVGYARTALGVPAANALTSPKQLADCVQKAVFGGGDEEQR